MIAILDYGAGNLHSVKNALDYIGAAAEITDDKNKILSADRVILPGVGAFGTAMDALRSKGLDTVIRTVVNNKTPFLGICLGLQLLFDKSEESPNARGLGIFNGTIAKIPACGLKIPHMGWNDITVKKDGRILKNLPDKPFMYFVHSYYLQYTEADIVSATVNYGTELNIAVEKDNIFAVQFHPEKSGTEGVQILKNFAEL